MKNLFTGLLFLSCLWTQAQSARIVVARDGSGDFTTVQAALDAIPYHNTQPVTIYVKNGVYEEKLHLDTGRYNVTLQGQDRYQTILTYNDHTGKVTAAGDTINTFTSESFLMSGEDFLAQDISFRNDAGFTAGQAVALRIDGDRSVFRRCRFIGNQDVLFPSRANTHQYFENCYIEGTTDFIFGPSTAWFEHCTIYSKKNSHVTAASTPQEVSFGYVFHECTLLADTSLHGVSLGRPWRAYASVVYLNCYLGAHILPEGWANWKNTNNDKTARFAEFQSCGPGASPQQRLPWAHQLPAAAARAITLITVFGLWNPRER